MMDSPFNLDAAKGRYMWSDLARICARHRLPLRRPDPFPQNSLLASRVALALDDARRPEFSRAVFGAEFGDGAPIAERATIAAILEAMGLDGDAIFGRADQGPATRRNGARGKPRHFRRAQPHHRRRRDFLGQRPARGRARLGFGAGAVTGAPDGLNYRSLYGMKPPRTKDARAFSLNDQQSRPSERLREVLQVSFGARRHQSKVAPASVMRRSQRPMRAQRRHQ
jgi:hypothetical protein